MHSVSPFLKTGTTLASFQFCGKEPALNDLLNSFQRDGAIREAVSLRRFAGILSVPVAFVTSRASSTDWTSLTVSVNSDISGEADALAALPDEGGGWVSWGKTDAK